MDQVRVCRVEEGIPLALGEGVCAVSVLPPGLSRHRSFVHITLNDGLTTRELVHPMECVYYVESGQGAVIDPLEGNRSHVRAGQMIFITPEQPYLLAGEGDSGVVFIGGPCPPDPAFLGEV